MKRLVAVSIGCPAGVGPEVAVLAASRTPSPRALLVGDIGVLRAAARVVGVDPRRLEQVGTRREALALGRRGMAVLRSSAEVGVPVRFGRPGKEAGRAQLGWIDQATDLVVAGEADALVTGPVSKLAIATSGAKGARRFRGHTEHLAARLGAKEVVMAFSSSELTTALVTTHLALSGVPRALTASRVATSAFWLADLLSRLARQSPRIAVAALNPHAGEGGLLGHEERTVIGPGIAAARRRIARLGRRATFEGPIGAETAFRRAVAGDYDGVLAMYHDQATIPCKLLGFGESVNVTLGLPIVRTSVDHGTGYDVAGRGLADPRGMIEALLLAERLVGRWVTPRRR